MPPRRQGCGAGDTDALVGGPGIAYDTSYVAAALAHPMDFVSIHAYANYGRQISAVTASARPASRPADFSDRYASFKDFGLHAPDQPRRGRRPLL